MSEFSLRLFHRQEGALEGVGGPSFEAVDDGAAITRMRELFARELEGSDYAKLVDGAGRLVWETDTAPRRARASR